MPESAPRPLHLHTLDSLLADLVSGRAVSVGDGATFALPNDRARSALQWYRKRGAANWAANVTAAHGEELVDAIKLAPPEVPALPARPANANKRRLTLVKLQAHRFAGLHKFGTPAAPPPDYTCDFSAPLNSVRRAQWLRQNLSRECNPLGPDRRDSPTPARAGEGQRRVRMLGRRG